jgi:hypothetical protein
VWAFVCVCPLSFLTSICLSAYLLERLDGEKTATMNPAALSQQLGRWLPNKVRALVPSLWWVDEIDMRQLSATLPFSNSDGGAWTQGWALDPVAIGSTAPHETLQVFVVPHSHCDPGWLKTFDDYFQSQTREILTTVVDALTEDPRRTFIWAEISYLAWWWREQTLEYQAALRRLVAAGQFEIVTGGWVMPDEANSHLYALQVQLQEGHDWIRESLGEASLPKYGWSIDPFGYSPTMAYLLKQQNFSGMVIQRVHYAVKKELARRQHLEFNWRQTWDTNGTYDIWTHVLPFFSYDVPHSCGPDPAVCCQFDFARKPVGKSRGCPWHKAPRKITKENVAERAHLLLDQYRKKASLYRSRAVLVPLGDDFRFQKPQEAEAQFSNYQLLFDYINQNVPGVQVQFGTLKDYFEAARGDWKMPLLKGSFFTYADVNEDYWSGYFTSRVFDKALDRELERTLYAAERLGANKTELRESRRALSLFQHHDGVTGTATTRVVHDYAYRMKNAIEVAQDASVGRLHEKFTSLLQNKALAPGEVQPCWLAGEPRGLPQNLCGDNATVVLYNPLRFQQWCGSTPVFGKKAALARLPCDVPGPVKGSKTKIVFDSTTGLMIEPIREEWMGWNVKKGGAYLFYPSKLFNFSTDNVLLPLDGGFNVTSNSWSRTVVERPVPTQFADSVSIIDFMFDTKLETDNQEWFVRFSKEISNRGVFHTDLNGFNFDTHHFRSDLPIQSQVFPMPTHAAIEDDTYRLTILSEHSQGTASLLDGCIDVWLDRRLAQDDGRGLGQGVQDNVPTRTRLRVILEMTGYDHKDKEFRITELVRRYWEELQHPLEMFGPRTKELDRSSKVADPALFAQQLHEKRMRREQLRGGTDGALHPGARLDNVLYAKRQERDPFTDDKGQGRVPLAGKQMFPTIGSGVNASVLGAVVKDLPSSTEDVPFVYMVSSLGNLQQHSSRMDSQVIDGTVAGLQPTAIFEPVD